MRAVFAQFAHAVVGVGHQIAHNDIIGQPFGSVVYSRKGCEPHLLLQPSLEDFLRSYQRATQVIYEKDAAYIIHRLGLHSGCTCDGGSGGSTSFGCCRGRGRAGSAF